MKKNSLVLFLNLGDSVESLEKSGQWERFLNEYLRRYCRHFERVMVVSYGKSKGKNLPVNCEILTNRYKLHRFAYTILVPFLHYAQIKQATVSRTMQATGGLPAIIVKFLWGMPAVVTYGYDYEKFADTERGRWLGLLVKILVNFVVKKSDKVIVTNKNTLSRVKEAENTVLIPNGVNVNKFTPIQIYNRQITKIINIGRLTKQKNQELIIKSIKNMPNVQLTLVGRGRLRSKLLEITVKKEVNLKIIEKVTHSKLSNILVQHDLYIQTSLVEGHPKALLEAMSVGLPCIIATDNLTDYGYLENNRHVIFCKLSEKSIRSAIIKLNSDVKLRQKLGKESRKLIETDFSLDTLLSKEIELLGNAAKNS